MRIGLLALAVALGGCGGCGEVGQVSALGADASAPQGRSLLPLARGETGVHRDVAIYGTFACGATITDGRYTYHTGWDMEAKPPVRLAWRAAHLFAVAPDGSVSLLRANVMLERRA